MARADKFHHRERLKAKRRRYWGRDLIREPKRLGQAVGTPTPCSCPMCGNPRHYAGDSMQERRAALSERDD